MRDDQVDHHMLGVIFQQCSFKAGLKKFEMEGDKAVNKELKQYYDMTISAPVDGTKLSRKEKTSALGALMFITQKEMAQSTRQETCTDGRVQHGTISKEDAMLPTCLIAAIFIPTAMEAHEGRNMSVIDLPGVFLYAETDEHTIMVLKCKLAEMMTMVDPKLYRKYVMTDHKC